MVISFKINKREVLERSVGVGKNLKFSKWGGGGLLGT